jgi:hypothetical protein
VLERRRPRAQEERPVGGVEQHGHEIRPAELAENSLGALELAEALDPVRAHSRSSHQQRHRIAGMDHVRRRGGGVVAGDAHDCPVGRQVGERRVEPLDRRLLDRRILRVAGGVGRLLVAEDEGVAGVQPLPGQLDAPAHVRNGIVGLGRLDRLQPEGLSQAAQEGRVGRERTRDAVTLEEGRRRARAAEPLERDHVEALALEAAHHLASPLLAGPCGALGLGDERLRTEERLPRTEEGVAVRDAVIGAPGDPEDGLSSPDLRQVEPQPVDLDPVTALHQPLRLIRVAYRVGPPGQPPAVLTALGRTERRVGEDVLVAHLLPAAQRLEHRAAGKLVFEIAQDRPMRDFARRRAPRPDRVEQAARAL